MKLAEALNERADLQKKAEMIRSRLHANSKVQEGGKPNEDPVDLMKELSGILTRLEYLIVHINRTNEVARTASGQTIAELIAHKDMLAKKISILGTLLNGGNEITTRVTRTEIRIMPAFDVKAVQKQVDELSRELRETDTKLQEQNWLTELSE
ncbi:MAG: DIP1984 family protein [Clostridiales bacterium]|nr:DIP1984 family protein [Clostridiales bacterium]